MRNGDRESGVTYLGPRSFVVGFAAFVGGFLVLLYGVDKMTETSEPRSPLPPLPPLVPSVSRLATLPAASGTIVVTASPRAVAAGATAAPKAAAPAAAVVIAAPQAVAVSVTATPKAAAHSAPAAQTVRAAAAVAALQNPSAAKATAASKATAELRSTTARKARSAAPSGKRDVAAAFGPHAGGPRVSRPLPAQGAPCHSPGKPAAALTPRVHVRASAAAHAPVAPSHAAAVAARVAAVPVRVAALQNSVVAPAGKRRHPMHQVPMTSAVLGTEPVLDPRAARDALVIVPVAATAPPAATSMRFRYLR